MAPILSKYLTKNNTLAAAGAVVFVGLLLTRNQKKYFKVDRKKLRQNVEEEVKYLISEKTETTKVKAHVDRKFLAQLNQLLKIIIPGWTSPECALLITVALSLVARSVCDLWMINNGTKIERYPSATVRDIPTKEFQE